MTSSSMSVSGPSAPFAVRSTRRNFSDVREWEQMYALYYRIDMLVLSRSSKNLTQHPLTMIIGGLRSRRCIRFYSRP